MRPDSEAQPRLALIEKPIPDRWRGTIGVPDGEYCRLYTLGECSVIVTREHGKWHLSIAHHSRYPTWDEISQARYRIIPRDVWVAMYLPPPSEYVNLHRFCFQLHECDPRAPEVPR
jgi:hypothetical protein